MASPNPDILAPEMAKGTSQATPQNYTAPLALMISLFFLFGFITVLNDILIPHLKGLFALSYVQAMLVQFCFFGAYFLVSLPAGKIIAALGYKKSIVLALFVVGLGLGLFYPASSFVSYPFFLVALFIIGSGITILQVAANPYISALGSPETASSRLNLAGGFNSFATFVGPVIGSILILDVETLSIAEKAAAVRGPYIGLALFALVLAGLVAMVKLPELIAKKSTQTKQHSGSAWQYRHLGLGAGAIFFYVGAEVTIGSFLINFLAEKNIAGLAEADAATYVSLYWGAAMVGRFIGFFALKKIKAERGLRFVSIAALLLIAITTLATGHVAMWAVIAVGLCNSIMWPCIFPLSIKNLGEHTAQGSGILIMCVVGGAIIPLVQGVLADSIGVQYSFVVAGICYIYILFFAWKGHQVSKWR